MKDYNPFTEKDMMRDAELEVKERKPLYGKSKKFTFGKYKGLTLEEIAGSDLDYLYWIIDTFESTDKTRYEVIKFFAKNDIPFKSVLTGKILDY